MTYLRRGLCTKITELAVLQKTWQPKAAMRLDKLNY